MAALAGEADSFGIYAMPVPPLLFDEDGASKVIACAELGIPLIWAPAPNAGTTAPASITSVIVVANAEVLAGLVLSQAVRPGAPFVWGVGVGAMNMRTMNEVYSSADVFRGHQAQTDLARWYDLPSFAYAAHTDSKVLDEQWSAEAALTAILGEALARDAAARRRLPRVRPAEQLRVDRPRRPPARLGQGVHGAAAGGRRGAGAGRDQGRRAGRQPPGPALHAQALPADLAERPVRHDPARRAGRRTGRRRCSTACRRGSRSCAPSRAPSSCRTTRRRASTAILADVEAHRPGA